jgi:hypothetical protein
MPIIIKEKVDATLDVFYCPEEEENKPSKPSTNITN